MTHEDSLSEPATPSQPKAIDAHPSSPRVRFRSKHGMPLDTNVVPCRQLATASAITPTPRPADSTQPSASGAGQKISPSAAFMTTLPGQESHDRHPVGDSAASSTFQSMAAKEALLQDAFIPGEMYGKHASSRVLAQSTKRGMVVAGMIVCGMLVGLTGIWWADQPYSHQVRAEHVAPAPETLLPTHNTSAFTATNYSPGGSSEARSELVIPTLPSLKKQKHKQTALQEGGENEILHAALEEEEEVTSSAAQDPIFAPAKVAPSKPRRAKVANKTQRNLQALRSCSRGANIFEREKCKWKVCGDSWGKNGCPAYN